jgi:hypothetical protein
MAHVPVTAGAVNEMVPADQETFVSLAASGGAPQAIPESPKVM